MGLSTAGNGVLVGEIVGVFTLGVGVNIVVGGAVVLMATGVGKSFLTLVVATSEGFVVVSRVGVFEMSIPALLVESVLFLPSNRLFPKKSPSPTMRISNVPTPAINPVINPLSEKNLDLALGIVELVIPLPGFVKFRFAPQLTQKLLEAGFTVRQFGQGLIVILLSLSHFG